MVPSEIRQYAEVKSVAILPLKQLLTTHQNDFFTYNKYNANLIIKTHLQLKKSISFLGNTYTHINTIKLACW